MNCFDVLQLLEKTSGKKDKFAILEANLNTPGLRQILRATFDYEKNYYIKKLPEQPGEPMDELTDERVLSLIESLDYFLKMCEFGGRTNDVKNNVIRWLADINPFAAKWFRRVILRDLRIGVSAETCAKAGYDIPVFEVQLAYDANKKSKDETPEQKAKRLKRLEEFVKKGVWVSRKLDGNRCIAVGVGGEWSLISRNGTEYENFPTIKEELARLFPDGFHVFDGEIMSDDFQSMQRSAFANKRKTCVGEIYYNIFDTIPYDEWKSKEFKLGYSTRYRLLTDIFQTFVRDSTKIRLVEHTLVYDLETVYEMQAQFEGEGFEGAMANPDVPYYLGRVTNKVTKFKSMETWDCEVVGFEEGEAGKKYEGMLGKFLVMQENGKVCGVGSGIADEDRVYVWGHKEEFLGRILEVKFQQLTPEKEDGTGGLMRFPVFQRWRNWSPSEGKI